MSFSFSRGRAANRPIVARLGLVALAFAMAACGTASPTGTPPATPIPNGTSSRPWMDTTKTPDQRAAALLAAMTLDEKIGQMSQVENKAGGALLDPNVVVTGLLGSVLSGGDGNPDGVNTADNWYSMVDSYAQAALGTRLGIPLIYGADMVHGDSHITGTTIFPHNIGLGATRDAALVTQVCQATAAEMYASGVRWTFGPVVAVPQDVRWGRTYEGYSENTDLVAQLGTACLTGLQGKKLTDPNTVVADPKHFLGDGGTAYGSSTAQGPNGPYLLDQGVDKLDNATITKMFLPPYESAVKNGARIIMTTFSGTQAGGKVTGDKYWITDILKTQLGFTGFVVSDWGAIDQINPGDYSASVKAAINAGEDMAMIPDNWQKFQTTLKALVQSGDVAQSRIDDAVTRILRVKFEMGLFENPMPPAGAGGTVGSDANRAIASQAVSESAVLLKNSGSALPVAADSSVLLAGAGADDIGTSLGGWSLSWQGQVGNVTKGTTLKAALEAKLGDKVTFDANGNFAGGTHAKVGIVVVAEPPYAEGVGDSATLAISPAELAVIDKVKPMVDKLVVVIISGRPVMLTGISDKADAVVAAWLPGTEDEGLADVLLGTKPFTGTTPYTWPKTPDDAPRIGKTACQGAVYPYGYGLDTTGKMLGAAAC
ncbi:MAG TPA: glycoside hydrolase family 3 protein [Candidatus Limnocylindrales bacterium]